jgi:hypothetical protein
MKKELTLLTAALSSSAIAQELTVSYTFAEVRAPITLMGGLFEWTPTPDLAQFLVPGSLELEYPTVDSLTLLPPTGSLLRFFEGKEVMVQLEDKTIVKAIVIRADLALFEIAGQYRQLDPSRVIFPSLAGVRFEPTYQWKYTGTGGKSNLSYLTRALSWSPRYTLTVNGDNARLTAWADLKNAGATTYNVPELTLVAGQINLEQAMPVQNFQTNQVAPQTLLRAADAPANVEAVGESAGLQIFKYPKAISMSGGTTTSVPFVNSSVQLERILDYTGYFSETPRQVLPMQRLYAVRGDNNLPAGVVTVREDNRVVGQARIGDTPKAERANMYLGSDFDLRLTRTVQVLERTSKLAKFRVGFSLTNTKTRAVAVRLRENLGGNYTLDAASLPNLKRETEGLNSSTTLNPNQKFEGNYTVTYRY